MVAKTQSRIQLLPSTTITTAVTGTTGVEFVLHPSTYKVDLQAVFTYGSGGTTAKFWVQTSIDGTNWSDIANFAFTTASLTKMAAADGNLAHTHATATDATLADNTVVNGIIGGRLRIKYTTTGTYAGTTTIAISAIPKANKSR
jgi:hypothetical protein